jgi:cytosine/adenosine deaminase-related metal-dependent hydrolase
LPLYDPMSVIAYCVEAADVRTVIVDGRIVLRDDVLTTADERENSPSGARARQKYRLLPQT